MKEIIYLDTDLMNSMLAQLEKGLITSYSAEQNSQENLTEGQQSRHGKKASINGSLQIGNSIFAKAGIGSSVGTDGMEITQESRSFLEGEKDILNKAFHDYALDVLQEKLMAEKHLQPGPIFQEGDIHLGESTYRFYDFELIKKITNYKAMKEIMLFGSGGMVQDFDEALEICNKKRKKHQMTELEQMELAEAQRIVASYEQLRPMLKVIKQLETLSSYTHEAFGDLSIIKMGNKVGILKKSCLRESSEALSFRTDKSRSIKYLVRIIGVKETVYSGETSLLENPEDMHVIPNMIFDVVLGSFNIINAGDVLVTPIAIYYE
ncbi:TPA: hypothetical protein QC096_006186 [Bacillus thuringiensis]|nr:hypothetical protein [Bacillus thuringiensis]HDR8174813.1 hypothetical protein [Bacillus thuringiensis]